MDDILDEDRKNPTGYQAFRSAAIRLYKAMQAKGCHPAGSAAQIINGLCWEALFDMQTNAEYCLNDQLGQLWARCLAETDKRFAKFFTFRVSRFDRLHPNY